MSRSSWIIIGAVFATIIALGALFVPGPHIHPTGMYCSNHLRQIGGLLLARSCGGSLKPLEGPAFLLQVREELMVHDYGIFLCPSDDVGRACSYAGPDLRTARSMAEGTLETPVIIACDREGFHDTGLVVLWSTGRVEFLRWREIVGAEGGDVVPVGPDAPDPRFRHLVK